MLPEKFSTLFKDIAKYYKDNTIKSAESNTWHLNFVSATDKYGILKKSS